MPSHQLSHIISGAIGAGVAVLLILGVVVNNPVPVIDFLQRSYVQREIREQQQSGSAGTAPASPVAGVSADEQRVIGVVQKAQPAVVSIIVTRNVPILEQYYEDLPFGQSPFGNPFGPSPFGSPFGFQIPRFRERGMQEQEVGGGSGFLVSADGMIVTNRHVVSEENAAYTVFTNDGKKYDATIVARDPVNDIAILKISASDVPFLEFGSSANLQVGQTAIAIGNALAEFRNTVSVGVISGLARSVVAGNETGQTEQLEEVIQTDAAINPGNSGGPLLDLNGRVVGVNVAMAVGSENIGFALPADLVKSVVESVQKTGRIVRPFLGIRYVMITPAIKESNQLPVDSGALVVRGEEATDLAITPGSAADKAGIVEGDVILEIDGVKLEKNKTLSSVIRTKKPGDMVTLKVWSKGTTRDVRITLGEVS
jgi:S1-C subfamily serine protease